MMTDYNQRECNIERDITLTECLEHLTEIAHCLGAMAAGDATWPRVGTLMSVRQRLIEIYDMLPAVPPSTEAEQVLEAGRRG
jgi:hypothetical protein